MKKIIALLFLTIITLPMMAFDEEDYKQFAREVKKEVWNKDLPQFNNRTIPTKYNKESAVVLARYEEVGVDYTNHFNPLSLGKVKQCTGTHLVRSLVKINDKLLWISSPRLSSAHTTTPSTTDYGVMTAEQCSVCVSSSLTEPLRR